MESESIRDNRRAFLEQLSLHFLINQTHTHTDTGNTNNSMRYFKSRGEGGGLCLTFTCAVIKTAQGRYQYELKGGWEGHQSLTKRGPHKYYIWQYYCWIFGHRISPRYDRPNHLPHHLPHHHQRQRQQDTYETFAYFITLTNWIISGQVFNTFSVRPLSR